MSVARPPTDLVITRAGEPAYEELLGPVRVDTALLERMWADAESRLDEEPDKIWSIAAVRQGGRRVAAAWAAAVEREHQGRPVLLCCNNYEVPAWRGRHLYLLAYAHRHAHVVAPRALPARTFVFDQPRLLHEADGWRVVDQGVSHEAGLDPHPWFEMWWTPPVRSGD